jgi:hypothetical protein
VSFAKGSRAQTEKVQVQGLIDEMAKIVRDTFPSVVSLK